MAKSLYRAADRAFSGYRMWKRIVEGARTAMRRAQALINQARKHLNDLMHKVPKKPKPPKKKPKPPTKPKPKSSEPAKPPKPKHAPKKSEKPEQTKPKQERPETGAARPAT